MRLFPLAALALVGGLSVSGSAEAAVLVVDCNVGPFLTIQAAVSASAPGDTVAVRPCPNPYAPFTVTGKQNLQVVGVDPTVSNGAGAVDAGARNAPPTLQPVVRVQGTLAPNQACVSIQNSAFVGVQGFELLRCGTNGIEAIASSNVLIEANRIYRTGAHGIALLDNVEFATISDNTVAAAAIHGVFLDTTFAVVTTDNLVGLSGAAGVFVTPANQYPRFVNNEARLSQFECLVLDGTGPRAERNTCLQNQRSGSGGPEIAVLPAAFQASVVGNDTGGAVSIVDFSGLADVYGNR